MHADQPHDRFSDQDLAAQLRAVPTPPQLVSRLRAALVPTDDQLDARLQDITPSASFLGRLKGIPEDCLLQDQLAAIAVCPQFVEHLKRIPVEIQPARQKSSWQRKLAPWGVAAALAWLLVSVGGMSFSWWFADTVAALTPVQRTALIMIDSPLQFAGNTQTELETGTIQTPPAGLVFVSAPGDENSWRTRSDLNIEFPDQYDPLTFGPVGEFFATVQNGLEPSANVVQLRWGILGAPHDDRDQVLLEQPFADRSQGIEPPLVKGYNRAFWLKHHVFPPLLPAIPGLQQLALPLTASAANFDRVEQLAMQGRKPAERDVRVEDFVAHALGFMPAARAGELELRFAAAPSPFGPQETKLLQCVVQAGPPVTPVPTHLLIAVDISSSMKQNWPEIQRTLCHLPERLGPEDRLSLLAFGEEVELSLEALSAADWPLWREQIQALQPQGNADLAAGLRAAMMAMLENTNVPTTAKRELLFISDHEGIWDRTSLASMAELLTSGQQADVKTSLIDLATSPGEAPSCLARLAAAAQVDCYGQVRTGPNEDRQSPLQSWEQIRFPPVASEVELSIQFNPQAVAAYRLVGHDQASWSDVNPAHQRLDFRPGDSRSSLLELAFNPNNKAKEIGRLTLVWRNPADGEITTKQIRLTRSQFTPQWTATPLWFQRSTIAAELAEVLLGSRQALRETGWSDAEQHHLSRVLTTIKNSPLDSSDDQVTARLIHLTEAWRKLGIK